MDINGLVRPNLSFDLKALYSNRLLQEIGTGLIGLFLPIFLFEQLGHSVQNVLIFFILSYLLFGLFVPLGAMAMSRIGLKYSMMIATFFLAMHCLCFYFFENNVFLFLGLALVAATLFRVFYWTPYHTDFAQFSHPLRRGRQVAFLYSLSLVAGVLTPISAGYLIENFGFGTLFLTAMLIVGLAIIPLFPIRRVYEKYSYSFFQTFRELLKKGKNRKILIGYGSDGAQGVVGMVIWPIFIFQLLNGEYLAVGAVSSAIILASVAVQLVMGDITDRMSKKRLMKAGAILFAFGWLIKMFIATGFQIFVASTYHSFAGIIRGVPFSAFMYEEMADQGHYIDEYTVLREAAISFGRVFMLVACFILLYFVGLAWTFLLAAIASLFIRVF